MSAPGRAPEQAWISLLAFALWSSASHPSLWALAAAYAAAWLSVSALLAYRPRALRVSLTRAQALALAAFVSVPFAAHALRVAPRALENEGLASLPHLVGARLRLERVPAIAPPLVAGDRPQTFYVHAPDAREVAVRFGASGARVEAVGLGHGLFRLAYDPREHGLPDPPNGEVRASIVVDGAAHERSMHAVQPLPHPRWLAPSPGRALAAAVSEETDELIVLDRRGLVHRVDTDDGPSDARFMSEHELVVAHRYASTLAFVNAAGGELVRRVEVGPFGHRLAVAPERRRMALGQHGQSPGVRILDASGASLERIALDDPPDHLAFGPDPDTLVVSTVRPPALHRFRRGEEGWRSDRPPLRLGRPVVAMSPSADHRTLLIAVTDLQTEGPPHLGNHFVQDQLVTLDVVGWSIVDQRITARRTPRQDRAGGADRGLSPMGIDALGDGALLVAFAGTDDVWRIEPDAPSPTIIELEAPIAAPFSAVALGDGFAVSSPSYGAIGLFSSEGRRRAVVRLAPSDRALLAEDERALQRRIGERTFYESTRAGIACQSCHLHGGSDGALHNIGGRTHVATLDTRGLLGTPPYLRDGSYPRLGSFDDALASPLFRGWLRPQGGRRVSLERYMEALPRPLPPRQLEGRDEARERRGLEAFVEARCVLCHSFPAFTNLGQHPSGALFPEHRSQAGHALDTPSLFGLGESAPYLVDGRAETLEAVFRTHDPAGRHGDTQRLGPQAFDDLLYFLEGL